MSKKPVMLMILDGWGNREAADDNAVSLANPGNFYRLEDEYPNTLLQCSGKSVGLPHGQMGNSEVGHLNMGAGRVVYQEISRISNAIEDESFFENKELLKAVNFARKNNGAVHLLGLLSDGGVHSHMDHLYALLDLCKRSDLKKVFVHGFLDGRDVAPKSALTYVDALETKMKNMEIGKIASLGGRFYGMDRDNRWERIERAYHSIVMGKGLQAATAQAAIQNSYEARVTDEFMEPVAIVGQYGEAIGPVRDGDSVIFFNFRADRARQISHAFVDVDMDKFERQIFPNVHYTCMTRYDINLKAPVAFPPQNLDNTLGEVLSQKKIRQLRIAETEKYAHLTFFFNGGVEEANSGEDRILVPSPKVATYNLQPEMSAGEISRQLIEEIDKDLYDVIMVNYANPDMVGHTGILEAAVKAVKAVDSCMIEVVNKVLEKEGTVLITADHGNCEQMLNPDTGTPLTQHTTSLVPFILVSGQHKMRRLRNNGSLQDIAPTMLGLLNIQKPPEMTGKSLIVEN